MHQRDSKLSQRTVLFQALVSFFGLVLVALFAVNPQVSQEAFVWRKPLIGSAFATLCILGILAALFPSTCSKSFSARRKQKKSNSNASSATVPVLRGHHPQCSYYSGHVLAVGGKMLCATCSGLFTGALLALVGVGIYFFGNLQFGQGARLVVAVGLLGVALGLVQSVLPILQNGMMRLFTGAFFVAGTFFVLLGNESLSRNVSLDAFIVALSVFWLMTKISLSKWDHERICSRCASESCDFKKSLWKKEV